MCILTELGPVSGRAGRKGRFELTSATRNPEHFTALDQILDGALNLCIIFISIGAIDHNYCIPLLGLNPRGVGAREQYCLVQMQERAGRMVARAGIAAHVPSN